MNAQDTPKLCECGCGEPAPLARKTDRALGYVKGAPIRFVNGHQNRLREQRTYIPLYRRFVIQERGYSTPCWTWKLSLDGNGYAQMWDRRRRTIRRAHRIFYELIVGPIPRGLFLDHLCRNRDCVNPDHLEPVTNLVNSRRGIRTKLTDADRALIFWLREEGLTLREIADHMPVHETTIGCLLRQGLR